MVVVLYLYIYALYPPSSFTIARDTEHRYIYLSYTITTR